MRRLEKIMGILFLLAAFRGQVSAKDLTATERVWNYTILTASISKDLGWIFIPGFKYEFLRTVGGEKEDSRGLLVYELFVGPYFKTHINKVKVMVPLTYHYMRFPNTPKDGVCSFNHSIDLFPSFSYRTGKSTFQGRVFFHNTFYSSFYRYVPSIRKAKFGYSLLCKLRVLYEYRISKRVGLAAGDEVVLGIIEDNNSPPKTGPGFTESGLDINKILLGFDLKVTKNLSIEPFYLYESFYTKNKNTGNKELKLKSNYLFVLFKCRCLGLIRLLKNRCS